MRALSHFLERLHFHRPFRSRPTRVHAWTRAAPQRCSKCHTVMVVDSDGDVHCPHGCFMTGQQPIVADAQAQRAMADVPTEVLSERPVRFDDPWSGTVPKAVDYRLQYEQDGPSPFPEWLNSARKAWSASVEPPAELSPDDTEERPALKYMIGLRQMAREGDMLYGQLPQSSPDA